MGDLSLASRGRNTEEALFPGGSNIAMGRYRTHIDSDRLPHMLKAGYGQGKGLQYRPWIEVTHVPSRGLVCRVRGVKTGRVHHLLSQLETMYWYALDGAPEVLDIREQFPLLPLEDTLRLADQLGYRHPCHPHTRRPIVMTTDFLVTVRHLRQEREEARAVKPRSELERGRVCEKLEIEHQYWLERGIDWGIVTEQELSPALARNLALITPYLDIQDRLQLPPERLAQVITRLSHLVIDHHAGLSDLSAQCDREFGQAKGTSLTIAYHLLARKQWIVDLLQPLHPDRPLTLLGLHGEAANGASLGNDVCRSVQGSEQPG